MTMDVNNIGGMANSNQQVGSNQGLGMIQGVLNRSLKRAIKGSNQRAMFKNQAELERYKSQNRREELADKYRLKEEYERRNPGGKAGGTTGAGKTAGALLGGAAGTLLGPEGTVIGAKIGGALGDKGESLLGEAVRNRGAQSMPSTSSVVASAQFLQPDESNAGRQASDVLTPTPVEKPRPSLTPVFKTAD